MLSKAVTSPATGDSTDPVVTVPIPVAQPVSTPVLLYTPRPLYRPRGGSGIDYYDLAVARPPVPTNCVDIQLEWGSTSIPPPQMMLQRGLLTAQIWDGFLNVIKERLAAARSRACRWVLVVTVVGLILLAIGIGLMVGADKQARATWTAQHPNADDDTTYSVNFDYYIPRMFPGLWYSGVACVGIGGFVAMFGWIVVGCRANAAYSRNIEGIVQEAAGTLAASTNGAVRATVSKETITVFLQAEGNATTVTTATRPAHILRLSAVSDDAPPLHPEMTLVTHGFMPLMPGYILGGDGKPVLLPAIPPGCILVNPIDLMSPAHGLVAMSFSATPN